jgi:hypothetical protein
MIEVASPVYDLSVNGIPGDMFLTAPTVTTPSNPTGIVLSMAVRGDGVDANTMTTNSDPNDPFSAAYSGPDASGNYTIYVTQPLIGNVTTATFTYWEFRDITPR